jgi:hypothetical protein
MKKQVLVPLAIILGFSLLLILPGQSKNKPITMSVSSSYRKMTIDDKIRSAELIVIGVVEETLPSRWKAPDGHNDRIPGADELSEARGLLTDSLFRVDRYLKGDSGEPQVRLRSFVGQMGNISWRNESQPAYVPGHEFLLFLSQDRGALAGVDPGAYVAVNARAGVYEIVGDKAISVEDEWLLTDLIAYVQVVLGAEGPSTEGATGVSPPVEAGTGTTPSQMP